MIIARLKTILKSNLYQGTGKLSQMDGGEDAGFNDTLGGRWSDETHHPRTPPTLEEQYYANLELEPGANFEQIKKNYRRLLSQYHPDKFEHDPQKRKVAEEVTVRLNEAWSWFKSRNR